MSGGLSLERLLFDPSAPADGPLMGSYLIGSGGTVISETSTYLDVNIAGASGLGIYAEDSAASGGEDGQSILLVRQDILGVSTSADGDFGQFKSNNKGELYVIDSDGNALLGTIDADTGSILLDTNAMVVDLAAIEVLITAGNIDLAAMEALLITIDADTSVIAGDTTSIDSILTALSKAEDAAHISGDQGIMGLAVRSDSQVSFAGTNGDYAPLQVEALGRLKINDAPNSAAAAAALVVGITEVAFPALAFRTRVMFQNNSNSSMFIGPTGVTTSSGIEVSKGGTLSIDCGPDVALFAISGSATQDARVFELA